MATISSVTWDGRNIRFTCRPAWLEYSRRDNIFRLWNYHARDRQIKKVNIPRITGVYIHEDRDYDLKREQENVRRALQKTKKSITLIFHEGRKNLPDRILTEFSLWQKTCSYDRKTDIFTLRIEYPQIDEKELLIRILRYGPYVKIVSDDGGYILNEIIRRVDQQREITMSREYER